MKPLLTPSSDQAERVIDRLYDVALDPMRYEELLDHWEGMIAPYRKAANGNGESADLGLLGLGSHFARADKMLDQIVMETPKEENAAILSRIENAAAFTINAALKVSDANPAAMSTLMLAPGMPLSELPLDAQDCAALSTQVERMLNANQDAPLVFRARSTQFERLVVFYLRIIRPAHAEAFAIAVSSEVAWPEGFDGVLQSAFQLSVAEVAVVRGLAQCASLKDIAATRGRSVDTIRAQLKSVMSKTETRSQTELVRLTVGMMEMAAFSQTEAANLSEQSSGYGSLEPRPFYAMTLRDGRTLEFLVLGDPMGKPCLFSPLDYGLVRWPASAEAEAAKRGIKIIVPVRAGYGKSTPLTKSTDVANSTAHDYAELMDHLGVNACPIISLGGDFFFSAVFHSLFPGRATAMLACAGVLPLDQPEQYERMDKWHRFILAGARYTPHLLPFMVKGGFALARRLGKRGFLQAVYGKSAADVATFEDPEIFEALICGSEVALSETHSAHDAFAREVVTHENLAWQHHVDRLQGVVPVHFFNGLQDPQVHPLTLNEHRSNYPWINFHVFPEAGQLVFFLKWSEVLDTLETYLSE
ncbi:helix-turn-helix transcriptional regulator [Algirhabdus cladophorae]|uniref:helix-turn-helix transcriptional regulator n=1 Tax=Algirhabdus cladophorae TaxID=3377108 RepID=UPI003B8458FB